MKTIYVVMSDPEEDFGLIGPIRAFSSKETAELFTIFCKEHDSRQPEQRESASSSDAFDEWRKEAEYWANAHPAGYEWAGCGGYKIEAVTLVDNEEAA